MERKTPLTTQRPTTLESLSESSSRFSDVVAHSAGFDSSDDSVKSAVSAQDSPDESIISLKAELQALKEAIAKLTSKAANNTIGLANDATTKVVDSVSGAASMIAEKSADVATAASRSAQSLSGEVEELTRRNPLPALAGAVIVGMLIGMVSRGRN